VPGLALLIWLMTGCVSTHHGKTGREPSACAVSAWRFVFANDGDGRDIAGHRDALLLALRRGSPLRVGWSEADSAKGWSVEEFSDVGFTNLMGGRDVVAQLEPGLIQSHYLDATRAGIKTPATDWLAIVSTDGRFEAVMLDRETGATKRRLLQRTRINWYAFAPSPQCDTREAILPPSDAKNRLIEDSKLDDSN
jgi:hypothetical protein